MCNTNACVLTSVHRLLKGGEWETVMVGAKSMGWKMKMDGDLKDSKEEGNQERGDVSRRDNIAAIKKLHWLKVRWHGKDEDKRQIVCMSINGEL